MGTFPGAGRLSWFTVNAVPTCSAVVTRAVSFVMLAASVRDASMTVVITSTSSVTASSFAML